MSAPEKTILDEAKGLIYGDRQDQYGDAFESFGNIADGWSIILRRNLANNEPVTPEQVTLMMDWLKTCRLMNQPGHHDSIVDKAGYAGCYEKVLVARGKRDEARFMAEAQAGHTFVQYGDPGVGLTEIIPVSDHFPAGHAWPAEGDVQNVGPGTQLHVTVEDGVAPDVQQPYAQGGPV